jgi:hypothetical protein
MGKTQGVLAAWLYHRVISQNPQWPGAWLVPAHAHAGGANRDEIIACIQRWIWISTYTP